MSLAPRRRLCIGRSLSTRRRSPRCRRQPTRRRRKVAKSPTKPSTQKLSDVAKHVVVPKGVVSTGWPAVEAKCLELGIRFRWWQKPIGRIILGKRADGKYATTIGGTGLLIPRQVGKTFLVGAVLFLCCVCCCGLS